MLFYLQSGEFLLPVPEEDPLVSSTPREVIADPERTFVKLGINITRLPVAIFQTKHPKSAFGLGLRPAYPSPHVLNTMILTKQYGLKWRTRTLKKK